MSRVRPFKSSDPERYPLHKCALYTYEDFNPPPRKEAGVKELDNINIKSPIDFDKLPETRNPAGEMIREFEYKYVGTCHGDSFDIGIVVDGERVAYENFDIASEVPDRPETPTPPLDSKDYLEPPGYTEHNSFPWSHIPLAQPSYSSQEKLDSPIPAPPSFVPYSRPPPRPQLHGLDSPLSAAECPRTAPPVRVRSAGLFSPPHTNPGSPDNSDINCNNPFADSVPPPRGYETPPVSPPPHRAAAAKLLPALSPPPTFRSTRAIESNRHQVVPPATLVHQRSSQGAARAQAPALMAATAESEPTQPAGNRNGEGQDKKQWNKLSLLFGKKKKK